MALRTVPALLLLCSAFAHAATPLPPLRPLKIVVLLEFEQRASILFLKQLQNQLDYIFARAGLDLQWVVYDSRTAAPSADRVVIMEMRGHCNASYARQALPLPKPGAALGQTFVNDGEVLPHSIIDCDQMARVTSQLRARYPSPTMVENSYLRLAGRVLTHELMHALLRTVEHHESHFTRSPLRLDAVDAAPRLSAAEVDALKRLGRDAGGYSLAHK